ncbi:MAG: hypothetical protein ABWZ40_06470 [Caulobacterales bacterium]
MAAVKGGKSAEAKAFLKFLKTDASIAVFTKYGFIIQ